MSFLGSGNIGHRSRNYILRPQTDAAPIPPATALWHMNTSFVEAVSGDPTLTFANNFNVPTIGAPAKFGAAASQYNQAACQCGPGAFDPTILNVFGPGAGTLDLWALFGHAGTYESLWSITTGINNYLSLIRDGAGRLLLEKDIVGVFTPLFNGPTVIANGSYHHIAVTLLAGTFYMFLDGVLEGSFASGALPVLTNPLFVLGAENTQGPVNQPFMMFGSIDEVRMVKGTAVWTSNFTPPTSAYSPP